MTNIFAQAQAVIAYRVIVNSTYLAVTDHSSFVRSLGFTPTAGNTLVAIITIGSGSIISAPPSGWSLVFASNTGAGFGFGTSVISKVSNGLETTVDFTFGAIGEIAQFDYAILELRGVNNQAESVTLDTGNGVSTVALTNISSTKDSVVLGIIHIGSPANGTFPTPYINDSFLINPRDGGTRPGATFAHWYPTSSFDTSHFGLATTVSGANQNIQLVFNNVGRGFSQAQALIFTPNRFAQTQGTIKAAGVRSGQAQAFMTLRIKPAQAQAQIAGAIVTELNITTVFKNTGGGNAQVSALTEVVVFKNIGTAPRAQVSHETQVVVFGVSNSTPTRLSELNIVVLFNRATHAWAQAQTRIVYPWAFAQATCLIAAATYVTFGQAQADIKNTYQGYAQANADINQTTQAYAQAQAHISVRHWGFAQALATATGYNIPVCGQAQAMITNGRMHAQAQARIKILGAKGYSQAQARMILATFSKVAQAQARMISDRVIAPAQANADIKAKSWQWAQAQAELIHGTRRSGLAQSQGSIKGFPCQVAQATVWIDTPFRYAQANALIDTPFRYANTQAWIAIGGWGVANVRAKIERPWYRHALAQARILAFDYPQTANSQALINQSMYTAQAQADIVNTFWAIGGAIATIIPILAFAHSQALMKGTITWVNGQAQADINQTYLTYAQAQAMMEQALRHYAQALADIKAKTYGIGYALALITGKVEIGQAQAFIHASRQGYSQAEAQITRNTFYAQAQAYVNAIVEGKVIDDRYLVNYNGYYLPGYLQTDQMETTQLITSHYGAYSDGSMDEYMGLRNKVLSLKFKITGTDFNEMKRVAARAGTILRSNRTKYTKMYINSVDRYYLAQVKSLNMDNNALTNTKFIEYTAEFDTMPWLYDDAINTVTDTGSLSIVRTTLDGGWTPATVKVTGTDVTVSGYTDTTPFTGFFSVSGAVNNLVIDSENYTATINGVNKNKVMNNLDYTIYVGTGTTYFTVSGATSITISYQNRWY